MIKIIWHGHSFVEIQTTNGSILIDPFIIPGSNFNISELPNVIAIALTHGHHDHFGSCIEIAEKTGCQMIGVGELMTYIKNEKRIENTFSMNIGGECKFEDFSIKLTNAIHSGSISRTGNGYYTQPCGIIIRIEGKSIYHAGDTALTYDMKLLSEFDKIDLAFLPIGDRFTMGEKDAIIATSFIKPKIVVPMHFNTMEDIACDGQEFAKQVMLNNYSTPKILEIGQYIIL